MSTSTKTTSTKTDKTDQEISLGQNSAEAAAKKSQPVSTTDTATADARIAAAVKPHLRGIGSAVKELREATSAFRKAETAIGFAKVKTGAALLPVFSLLTDPSGSFKWSVPSAVQYCTDHYLKGETNEKGEAYSTTTVHAWIVAGEQEALLPEADRNRFNSDAHRTFARVRKAKGDKAMTTFASALAKKGETSARKVRAAYDKKYPAAGKPETNPASEAAAIVADQAAAWGHVVRMFERTGISPSTVYSALYSAVSLGQAFPEADPEATSMAVRTLCTKPKPKATKKATAKK